MVLRVVRALLIRLLQVVALYAPGSMSVRVRLHRLRGVRIGTDVFIGTDVLLETSRPELIWIGDRVVLSIRCSVIAHFRGTTAAERGEGTRNTPCASRTTPSSARA